MSVLKNLRTLSTMEYYKLAIFIRRDLTQIMLRDFGTRRNLRTIHHVIKDISDEDQKLIDGVFEKYGKATGRQFESEMPEWFITSEQKYISRHLWDLITYITEANSIYPLIPSEWDLRRQYQDKAISCCYGLYQELQYVQSIFPQDLIKLAPVLDNLEREVHLLKGWRQSDNKRRKTA